MIKAIAWFVAIGVAILGNWFTGIIDPVALTNLLVSTGGVLQSLDPHARTSQLIVVGVVAAAAALPSGLAYSILRSLMQGRELERLRDELVDAQRLFPDSSEAARQEKSAPMEAVEVQKARTDFAQATADLGLLLQQIIRARDGNDAQLSFHDLCFRATYYLYSALYGAAHGSIAVVLDLTKLNVPFTAMGLHRNELLEQCNGHISMLPFVERVLESGTPELIRAPQTVMLGACTYPSAIIIPIKVNKRYQGVILLCATSVEAFDQDRDLRLARSLGLLVETGAVCLVKARKTRKSGKVGQRSHRDDLK